jgi:pilus assembly protein CpaC
MRKWLALVILVIFVAEPQAQTPAAFGSGATPGANPAATSATSIDLMVGRSTLLNVGAPIARVSLTVPDIADALVTSPQQLLIHGKKPGTISLFVWDKTGGIKTYEISVKRDLSILSEQLRQLFPGETVNVHGSGKDVVVSGTVSTKYVVDKAAEVAGGYVEKADDVVNLLKIQEGVASNQVLLRVRFAEVSRSAMQELGATFFANGYKSEWFGRTAPPGVPAPDFEDGKLIFSDFLNLFVFNSDEGLGAAIRALATKGLFQSLAEPNLVATNGKEATFLAGGEYPYPIATPSQSGVFIAIQFKEFGVRLTFTPTVLADDLIHLKLKPEVSALDFSNAVTLEGFRVPALSTRRTETEVELRNGQTFAIAGLLNNTVTSTMSKIPGIGDIPILGLLFRSRAHQKNQTELVVMITPHILKRGSHGAASGLPSLVEPYLDTPHKILANPPAHIDSPRYPAKGVTPPQSQASPQELNGRPAAAPATATATTTAPASSQTAPKSAQPKSTQPTITPAQQVARPAQQPTAAPASTGSTPPAPQRPTTAVSPAQAAPQQPAAAPATTPAPPRNGTVEVISTPSTPQGNSATPVNQAPAKTAKDIQKRMEQSRREEEERQAEAARKAAEDRKEADELAAKQAIEDAKKAQENQKVAEKRAREQAKRDAESARKADEARKKQAEEDAKRNKAIADAAARLKEAQAAYQAAVKTNGDKSKPQQ